MSEGAALAVAASEGGGVSDGQPSGGNPAGEGDNNQAGAASGENEPANGGGGDDDLNDWSDPRTAKNRFTTLTALKEQAEKAAREAEAQANYFKGLAEGRQPANGQPKPAAQQKADPNPEPDHTDKAKYPLGRDDPQFIEDRALWRLRAETAAANADKARREAAQADFNTRREAYQSAVAAAQANADTPNAAKQLGEMVPAITDLVATSAQAALIAEHLHSKPEEYKALVKHVGEDGRLTPKGLVEVSRKLGVLEATLPGVFAARKVSKAPTPAEQTGGGGKSAIAGDPYRKPMTTEEYRAWREAGGGE